MEVSIGNLNYAAEGIRTELDDQTAMLDDLDRELDEAGDKMNFVTEKIGKLLKTKSKCGICTVILLVVIVVVLLLIVVTM